MVKGTTRQVILVQGAEEKLFEQAIFILKDRALGEGVTEEALLKEAKAVIRGAELPGDRLFLRGPVWAAGGAVATALLWLMTALF